MDTPAGYVVVCLSIWKWIILCLYISVALRVMRIDKRFAVSAIVLRVLRKSG
jgi:hypothetical protein